MSESTGREWRFYLGDMIECAEKVLAYSDGFDQAGFVNSGLNYDATVRNLELIGEAATHAGSGSFRPSGATLAAHRRHSQPSDSWLSGHR